MRWIIVLLLLGMPQIGWKGEGKIPLSPLEADRAVDSIGREYYRAKLEFYPAYATSKGVRDFDGDLATFAPRRVGGFSRKIRRLDKALQGFYEDSLSMGAWVDFKALSAEIRDLATQRDEYLKREVTARGGAKASLDAQLYGAVREQAKASGLRYEADGPVY